MISIRAEVEKGRTIDIESGVLRAGSAGSAFYREQLLAGDLTDDNLIEQLFGRRGLDDFLGLERGVEDADTRLEQGILDTAETYNDTLIDNTLAVNALTSALLTPQAVNLDTYSQPPAAPILASTAGSDTCNNYNPFQRQSQVVSRKGYSKATSESGESPVINLNQTFYIQLDDGSLWRKLRRAWQSEVIKA